LSIGASIAYGAQATTGCNQIPGTTDILVAFLTGVNVIKLFLFGNDAVALKTKMFFSAADNFIF
jgi:hypothetical protein